MKELSFGETSREVHFALKMQVIPELLKLFQVIENNYNKCNKFWQIMHKNKTLD